MSSAGLPSREMVEGPARAPARAMLHAAGKRVVVVAPPPKGKFDIGLCLERKHTGKLTLGRYSDCSIAVGSDSGGGEKAQMRCDRDGVSRPPRRLSADPGQRNPEGAHSFEAAGDRRSLMLRPHER